MRLYFDSSAYAKKYLEEAGAARVRVLLEETDELLLGSLTLPEVASTLNRLRREGRLSAADYERCKACLLGDLADATVVPLSSEILLASVRCLEGARLRASDAVHVASALETKPDRFASADRRQCEAARAMGLEVEEIGGPDEAAGGADGTPR